MHQLLFFIMAAVAMVNCHVPEWVKVSLTNGRHTVTWNHRPEGSWTSQDSRYSLRCGLARVVPAESISETHKVVRRSGEDFTEDASRCVTHEKTRRQIMTGTKWCGAGNSADHYHDLGLFSDVDECCRAHDHCPRTIITDATKHGIYNYSPFTWSDCKCDDQFRTCLHDIDNILATTVGKLYFDAVTINKCIKFDKKNPSKAKAINKGTYHSKSKKAKFWDFFKGVVNTFKNGLNG